MKFEFLHVLASSCCEYTVYLSMPLLSVIDSLTHIRAHRSSLQQSSHCCQYQYHTTPSCLVVWVFCTVYTLQDDDTIQEVLYGYADLMIVGCRYYT